MEVPDHERSLAQGLGQRLLGITPLQREILPEKDAQFVGHVVEGGMLHVCVHA